MADDAREHTGNQAGHGQPPYHGVPANALPLTATEDRQWATLAHFGGILGCVPSLLIYLIFKDRGPFTAQESKSIHFHQVHLKDEARIEHRKVCPKDDKEVSSDEIVKGYELSDGGIVVLTKEEIAAAAGSSAKLIDVETFVPDDQIDPIFYDKTYYLGAGEDGEDAFRLLRKALEETDKVAIGRWVFHERERLVAVKPLDGVLGMHVMNFHDEVVEPDDLDLPSPQKNPTERELEMAGKLVK